MSVPVSDAEVRSALPVIVPYEDEADLAWQMDWLQGEMVELAEGQGYSIEVEMQQEVTGKRW